MDNHLHILFIICLKTARQTLKITTLHLFRTYIGKKYIGKKYIGMFWKYWCRCILNYSNKISLPFRVVVGELDETVDSRLDLASLRAEPLSQIVHWGEYTLAKLKSFVNTYLTMLSGKKKSTSQRSMWCK